MGISALTETSGLAASRRHEGVLWAHNDSGDGPHLYAFDTTGRDRGRVTLVDANARAVDAVDWEDLAIGPGPDGTPWLTVADTGDNQKARATIRLWSLPEPVVLDLRADAQATALELTLPGGPVDIEALLVDPVTGAQFLLSKQKGKARVFAVEGSTVREALTVRLPAEDDRVTGGDISPDGSRILLRTRQGVLLADRAEGASVEAALAGPWCQAPTPAEAQGEALGATSTGFFTVGEGARPTLYEVVGP